MPGNPGRLLLGRQQQHPQQRDRAGDRLRPDRARARTATARSQAMDYILGRNALNQSYVTGWGENAAENQHSRIFGHQLDAAPAEPAGRLDRRWRQRRPGRPVRRQAARRLQAAVLLRRRHRLVRHQRGRRQLELGAGLDRLLPGRPGRRPARAGRVTCRVTYTDTAPGRAASPRRSRSPTPVPTAINGWRLRWSFLGGQEVENIWSTVAEQSGATVSTRNMTWNGTIAPGRSVTFGFIGVDPGGANPVPGLFTLNGAACSLG